jgi:hypothetical protein
MRGVAQRLRWQPDPRNAVSLTARRVTMLRRWSARTPNPRPLPWLLAALLTIACNRHPPGHHEAEQYATLPEGESEAPNASWWVWAASTLPKRDGSASDDEGGASAWIGPSVAIIEPDLPVNVDRYPAPREIPIDQEREACETLWLLRRVLPPDRNEQSFFDTLRAFQRALATVAKGDVRFDGVVDLGFGLHRATVLIRAAKAVECRVDTAAYDAQLFQVRVTCEAPDELAPAIHAALGGGFSPTSEGPPRPRMPVTWRAEYRLPDVWQQAKRALHTALGPPLEAAIPPELSRAYERLTSPLAPLIVWRRAEGWGDHEIRALADAREYALLRAVLRGPNPEGRAYAAVMLQQGNALSDADRRAVQILARLSPRIHVGIENRDDAGGYESASRFFSTLRWPTRADVGY